MPINIKKQETLATNFANNAIKHYFSHKCFKTLESKKKKLDDSIDMRFNSTNNVNNRVQNAWRSNIAIPMVREAFLTRRAVLSTAFSQPDLITLEPDNITPHENAKNMQDVITTVIRNTHFHENTLEPVIDSCARYGTSVAVSHFDIKETWRTKTVESVINGYADGYERQRVKQVKRGVYVDPISILNYFQQPEEPNPDKALYRGYVERIPVYQLENEMNEAEEGVYLKKNISAVKKMVETGSVQSENYTSPSKDEESDIVTIDRYHYYGKMPFKGNRADDTTYYIQIVAGKIIRFQENPHDDDLIPTNIYTIDKRPEYWWGTTDAENVVPMENYMQMILSMYADSAMQEMQRFIFYDTTTNINTDRINQAAKNGGFIPFDRKPGQNLKDIFHQYQFPGISTANINYIVSETKEAAQRVRPKADFTRQPNQGGLQNKTATAANVMQQQAGTLESYPLRIFSYCLQKNVRSMIVLLQQHLGDQIIARPKPTQDPVALYKRQILGDFNPIVSTSLTETQINRSQKLLNFITGVQNFKGSGDPTWLRFNLVPVIRQWTKDILENNVDTDVVYPELTPQEEMANYQRNLAQSPGMAPGGQQPSGPQGVMQNVA